MPDKAVLLGVNAYKNFNSLRGCVHDVQNMRDLLTEKFGFLPASVRLLLDEKVVKTEVNKLKKWLFKDAKPGDRLILHFSGHGSQIPAENEEDGVAEMICLHDMDFHDPGTFLTSIEMREWTKGLPEGAQLTILFDSCHSGHGTRLLVNVEGTTRRVPMLVDTKTGFQRAQARVRSLGVLPREIAASVSDPDHEDVVRVRYIEPPPDIQDEIKRRMDRGSAKRELVRVDINHVLLAACRKDQTAADATIQGSPNGAFTFHLCKVLREGGANLDREVLIKRVEEAMAAEHFDQSPQLETSLPKGPLFKGFKETEPGPAAPAGPSPGSQGEGTPARPPTGASTAWSAEEWQGVFHEITKMPASAQILAIEMMQATARPAARSRQRDVGTRVLVYVHGICKHVAGFSNGWWDAMHPFTTVFGEGVLGETRLEVVWSDLVNEKGLTLRATRAPVSPEVVEHERAKREIVETLQDRLDRHAIEALPRTSPGEGPRALQGTRGLPSIPGLNCIDDFTVYLTNDKTRADIIGRFTEVVRPLLTGGDAVDIISHSWGTVVTYEGLRQLEDDGLVTPSVNNLFTVGAALSIGPVKSRLRDGNQDGRRPAMVKHWVNVNARGDLVGGPLKDRPFAVDEDFPGVTPFGCPSFLGLVTPQCAHGSYFVEGNVEVNRDIFAQEINNA